MRELETIIDYINKGLRTRGRDRRNSEGLTECFNLVTRQTGLEPHQPITDPFSGIDLSPSWPFPQLIDGKRYRFLVIRDTVAGEDRLYSVAADWSLTLIIALDYATFGTGDRWFLADFDEYVMLTNGTVIVYWDTTLSVFQTVFALPNTPRCDSICNFRGQLIGGSVKSAWHSCDGSSIVWSKIGDIDCTPDRRNEAGLRRHPYRGTVYQVIPLGNAVVVYGSGGVMGMKPVVQPVPSFGFIELYSSGTLSRYAAGGDDERHIFIDEKGVLYTISSDIKLERLGYEEFLADLVDPVITFDNLERDFYIGDATRSFVFNYSNGSPGLTEVSQSPISLMNEDGIVYGTLVDLDDDEVRITTDLLDMGYRGQKTTEVVEVGLTAEGTVEAAVDWRMNKTTALARAPFIELNDQGIAAIRVAGTEFRVSLKGSSLTNFNVDYLKLRYKMTDMRSIRGIYAAPPRGQG